MYPLNKDNKVTVTEINKHFTGVKEAAAWFSERWDVPEEAYVESMREGIARPEEIPNWFVVLDEENEIIGGAGMIANDFHERKDLTPNVCALYVEPNWRGRGIARQLLETCRRKAGQLDFSDLYLITDHTAFYEACGWEFLTMVSCEGGESSRMYRICTGNGVSLQSLGDDHLPLLKKWLVTDHVRPWYEHPESWIDEVNGRKGEFNWIHHFVIMADETPVGFCQYYPYWKSGEEWHGSISTAGTFSIDYMIGEPEYLNRGLASRAVKMLSNTIAGEADAKRIIVQPDSNNIASQNTLLSAGYIYDKENQLFLLNL